MRAWKVGLFGLGCLALLLVGAEAVRTFQIRTLGVVDIAEVFEKYEKRGDRQAELKADMKQLDDRLKDLERKFKDIVQELPQVEKRERKKELAIQKVGIELEVDFLKKEELERVRRIQIKYIQEIRDEITEEIRTYAQAQDLDLVIEKKITAEGDGNLPSFQWPLIHYVKPELDITKEIADRLNRRYRGR